MDFRILGPIEVLHDGQRIALAGPKPRTLLAALLLEPGRTVATDRLVDGVWGEQPPGTAGALVQTYISSLRRTLTPVAGRDLIATRPPGYALDIDPAHVDLSVFHGLAAAGREAAAAGRHREAADQFRAALALWRGPALAGLGEHFLRAAAVRLDELRLVVTEERLAAELAIGLTPGTIAELAELVHAHPLRERLRGQLMLALYRSGRQADALTVYREGRAALIDELGIDPGPELRTLHDQILRNDATLLAAPSSPAPPPPADEPRAPTQLPPAIADFVGREEQVAQAKAVLTGRGTPICAVSGKAGTGKTALSVHVAQQVAASFPDGQLYAGLRGAAAPVLPAEVLARFLRALGVPSTDVPESLEERAALYRSTLGGRRVLVVLDDAINAEQVRPLLPGSAGCAVLVTSRIRLAALAGAALLDLDVLPADEALALLGRVAGQERVAADPAAAQATVALCGYLPLAVRTAGARLAARSHWPVAHFARRLSDERRRLDELSVGDLEVRASLALSYADLGEVERSAFRRLGLLGVPDFAPWIAGPLLDRPVHEAEQVVERLVDARLLDPAGVDAAGQVRYRLHDLLRVYARECAEAEESVDERSAALTRLLGTWLWLVSRAAAQAPSGVLRLRGDRGAERPLEPDLADDLLSDAGAWFEAEQQNLVTAVERASALDLDEIACELAAALVASPVAVRNQFDEWWRTHDAGLTAARRAGNRRGEAMVLAGLGQLRYEQDRFADAHRYLHDALAAFREVKDAHGEATVLATLSTVSREQGHFAEAARYLDQAQTVFTELADDHGVAYAAYGLGTIHREQGRFPAALDAFDKALRAYRSVGSRRGEGLTLRGIALVHRAEGRLAFAAELSQQAIAVFAEVGDRLHEAYARQSLAKVRIREGRGPEALAPLHASLATCIELGDRYGEALMQRTLGELHLATGALADAERHLVPALRMWQELDVPLFAARTLRDLSILHAARGDSAASASALDEALDIFRTFDSREYRELTETPAAAKRR
jgi:DNA-binding SARP family transcriptional activator